jgi:hypothetical protein
VKVAVTPAAYAGVARAIAVPPVARATATAMDARWIRLTVNLLKYSSGYS